MLKTNICKFWVLSSVGLNKTPKVIKGAEGIYKKKPLKFKISQENCLKKKTQDIFMRILSILKIITSL